MTTEEIKAPVKRRKPSPYRFEGFSMDMEDERDARKHIKENMLCIQQNLQNEGKSVHFKKTVDKDSGHLEYRLDIGVPSLNSKGEKQIMFNGMDYISIKYDPARKLPRSIKRETQPDETTVKFTKPIKVVHNEGSNEGSNSGLS